MNDKFYYELNTWKILLCEMMKYHAIVFSRVLNNYFALKCDVIISHISYLLINVLTFKLGAYPF